MRNLAKLGLTLVVALAAGGCVVEHDPAPYDDGGSPPPPPPAPALDAARPLGAQQMLGYRVLANAAGELPAGDLGFVVTANGNGGYRLIWSDTYGSAAQFSAVITTDGVFDARQVQGYSGAEDIAISADGGTITASSVPGANVDGVDLVSSTDPIYVDLTVDGAHNGFGIYFTGAESAALLTSDYNPVAFTSP